MIYERTLSIKWVVGPLRLTYDQRGSTSTIRCRIDNLVKMGNGNYRVADAKSSIVNNLSNKTAQQLKNSMSTKNQKLFYNALKSGDITQINPKGQNAINFLENLDVIQVESSIDFYVNDVATEGYGIFKKVLTQ